MGLSDFRYVATSSSFIAKDFCKLLFYCGWNILILVAIFIASPRSDFHPPSKIQPSLQYLYHDLKGLNVKMYVFSLLNIYDKWCPIYHVKNKREVKKIVQELKEYCGECLPNSQKIWKEIIYIAIHLGKRTRRYSLLSFEDKSLSRRINPILIISSLLSVFNVWRESGELFGCNIIYPQYVYRWNPIPDTRQ